MSFDIIIRNGQVVDGSGNPWCKADVAVKDGMIVKVARFISESAARVIDASGLTVTPGFIDVHSHSEITILVNPRAESMIRQGVTSMACGNCGYSPAPISDLSRGLVSWIGWWRTVRPVWNTFMEYCDEVERRKAAVNLASFAGHGFVRAAVMGHDDREPTVMEMEEMKRLVAEAMEDGVIGLSTGLGYPPGCYADTGEIIDLCRVVARYGGLYATHARQKNGYIPSILEALEICESSGCPVQISHVETHYGAWGLQDKALSLIDGGRTRGLDVAVDVCVHLYGATWLAGCVMPEWAFEGGGEKMLERLRDPATRLEMRREMVEGRSRPLAADGLWDHIMVLSGDRHPEFVGKNMAEIAESWGKDPWEAAFDLLLEEGSRCTETAVALRSHSEEDLRKAIGHPLSMPMTDLWTVAPYGPLGKTHPHPRGYATFPLVFRKYVRGETRRELPFEVGSSVLTLEEAVRKMTSLPAQRLKLRRRGLLREGMWADVVVFDQGRIADEATYLDPHRYPKGITYVLVNGTIVVDEGEHTGALPGRVLRGPGYLESG